MKKGFLFLLLVFSSHVFGFKYSSSGTTFFSELLIWQLHEISEENWGQILGPTGTNQQIQFLDVPFNWRPGLRVGLGYTDKENLWNFLVYYTGYQSQGKNQASINSGEIHSAFLGNFFANNLAGVGVSGPFYHQAGIKWTIDYNTLDLEIGRPLPIDKLLNLRLFTGLKAAVINQTIDSNWQYPYNNTTKLPITSFSSATEQIKNDFSGIGPSIGLDSTWQLYEASEHTLSIIGTLSGAFLWGRWVLRDVYQNDTPVRITVLNETQTTAATMARGYIGLEWDRVFHNGKWNIRLGYEGQVWFNQLRYYSFDMGRTNDSLFLNGAVLDFSFHF